MLAPRSSRGFAWPRDITSAERKSLIAGSLGWMLDAMDVMLYSFVLAYLMHEFRHEQEHRRLSELPSRSSPPLSADVLFGVIADRIGRTRALMASILVYSVATAACGLSRSVNRACRLSLHPRTRAWVANGPPAAALDRGDLARRASRQSSRPDAIRLRHRRSHRRGRRSARASLILAGALYFLWACLPALLVFWIQRSVPGTRHLDTTCARKERALLLKLLFRRMCSATDCSPPP